ncbi:TetR/AcrR family transcriptional regulator [Rhodococcus sp. NBC_00297]|uniref:TetR/AcrR family transcriptional regulator n=1 Tax=Rhodococcus sp. NBC_00297 TaxID=2976005 RepID=UPI002E289D22|nr:TetR/AcrR family transcriptional regulator [Rhodococcus sp. NBC_00297]
MAGRPRSIDNTQIFEAMIRVMGRTGPGSMSLASVAEEAGIVPGTLVQRFGSKRGLILALAEYTGQRSADLREQAQRDQRRSLDVLIELLVGAWDSSTTPQQYANHLAFLCADLADAQFLGLTQENHRSQRTLIDDLLHAGVDTGDLLEGTDVENLTATIQSVIAGAGVIWAIEQRGPLTERLHSALEQVLAPHRTPTP